MSEINRHEEELVSSEEELPPEEEKPVQEAEELILAEEEKKESELAPKPEEISNPEEKIELDKIESRYRDRKKKALDISDEITRQLGGEDMIVADGIKLDLLQSAESKILRASPDKADLTMEEIMVKEVDDKLHEINEERRLAIERLQKQKQEQLVKKQIDGLKDKLNGI
ncbi:MAG: hypothetical protein AAB361_01480 [Patescibacteria group bacterium]